MKFKITSNSTKIAFVGEPEKMEVTSGKPVRLLAVDGTYFTTPPIVSINRPPASDAFSPVLIETSRGIWYTIELVSQDTGDGYQ